jgi:alkylated DNA nucleotide flippase Atl1
MKRAHAWIIVVAIGLLSLDSSVGAWGMDVHRWITRRAIDGLPPDIRPFFHARIDFISEHSADPDLWRVVGLRGALGEEDPNHYLDLDGLDEPAPFNRVPRDLDAFIARYGIERANKMGRVPWRTEEVYTRLVNTFRDIGKGTSPYAADNARYLVAVLAHYVEDAHVPFHATTNHDGQLTNQRGIHSRFESELVMRNLATLKPAPVKIQPIPNVRDFVFDTLVESQSLVAAVLDTDRRAAAAHPAYDDAYYAAFRSGARSIVEKRLGDATSGVASVVTSAWEAAGRPKLPVVPGR